MKFIFQGLYLIDLRKEIGTKAWSQSRAQTRCWTISGESELRNGSSVYPPVLNADSEATVETGTASTSLANLDNTWYLFELAFHHPNISNCISPLLLSQFSAKYLSISLVHSMDCSTSKNYSNLELTITYGSLQPIDSRFMCVLSLPLATCTLDESTWVKIIQLDQGTPHQFNHHISHFISINFKKKKKKLQKPQLLSWIKNHNHIQEMIHFIPFPPILIKLRFHFSCHVFQEVVLWFT